MSDIKVYGEHEPKTLAQMQRCMTVGSAVKGVLCADGHLGYAHPIGGVVAYAEDISISGVGFDIACGNMAARLRAAGVDLLRREDLRPGDLQQVADGPGQRVPAERHLRVGGDLEDLVVGRAGEERRRQELLHS